MKHLPHYKADERTRYRVRVVIYHEVKWLTFNMDLEECQRAYIKKRDETGYGASKFSSGDVFDERGQHIARISYNGKLWEALAPRPGMEPLALAPASE